MINNYLLSFSIIIFGLLGVLLFMAAIVEVNKKSITLLILSCASIAVSATLLIELKGGC